MIISQRHKKSRLKTRVVRRISDIPPEDWHKAFPSTLESYDFFKTLDESHLEQFTFYYIMVYDRQAPVGAAACFLMDYSLDTSIGGPWKRITNVIKRLMPKIFSIKALICGTPLGQGRIGIVGDPGVIIRVILRRMEQIAKKNKACVLAFKDFDKSYAEVLDPLQKEGFSRFDSLPGTELNISFKDFEGYLKTLSSATRYDLRRKFKKVDDRIPIDLEVVDSLKEDVLRDVYRLYLDIVERHEMEFEVLSLDFFRNISRNMPGCAKFFLWRIEGRLVTFLFCLVSRDLLIDYYVGFDYTVAHTYHLYFIKFRDTLNWCIEHGIKRYNMGTTGYEPKRRLGFTFIPLFIYARLRNRMLRPVFTFLCQFLKFENFDPDLKKARERRPS